MKYLFTLTVSCLFAMSSQAQEKSDKWDLRRCVDYATKNNISVKQADVQARVAALQLQQAKYYNLPSASFNTSASGQNGRSIDPTTNQYTTTQLFSQNVSFQGNQPIYSFGRVKKNADAAAFSAQAALVDIEKAANDVSLNVAIYYLQVLSANEQVDISQIQIAQTKYQIDITRKKVEAGSLPELNLLELQAKIASDSSTLISNKTIFDQDVLALKGLLNLDAALPFAIETPAADKIPVESFAELEPESVYRLALTTQPLQKGNDLRIKAAQKYLESVRSAMYPSLSANYTFGSTYNNKALTSSGVKQPYLDQLDQNFRQSLGLNLSIPIFTNGTNRINYEQSKLSLQNSLLTKESSDQKLKSDIYTAYTNAVNSLQKYNAAKRSVENAQKAYDNASKRYEVGLLGTLDLITNQNNLLTAQLQQVSSQYDYVFRMKLLEFYKGQGLKL